MSRVDEAWRRMAGAAPHSRESAARVEQVDDPGHVLHHYPVEGRPAAPLEFPRAAAPQAEGVPLLPAEPVPTAIATVTSRAPAMASFDALPEPLDRLLIVGANADPIAVEQHRRLAGTLQDVQREQGLKTLMVTSALPGEGKTLTISNLALTLSEACARRVLLIDADLRRPAVHRLFRLSNAKGLADVLQADEAAVPFVQVTRQLAVLPAGRLDQPMALTSDRMRQLIERCEGLFDWVLIDTAPVGFMPDAQVLARLTRAVVFVIAAHETPHQLVTRAVAEVGTDLIVGTVLNHMAQVDIPAADYFYDYYAPQPSSH